MVSQATVSQAKSRQVSFALLYSPKHSVAKLSPVWQARSQTGRSGPVPHPQAHRPGQVADVPLGHPRHEQGPGYVQLNLSPAARTIVPRVVRVGTAGHGRVAPLRGQGRQVRENQKLAPVTAVGLIEFYLGKTILAKLSQVYFHRSTSNSSAPTCSAARAAAAVSLAECMNPRAVTARTFCLPSVSTARAKSSELSYFFVNVAGVAHIFLVCHSQPCRFGTGLSIIPAKAEYLKQLKNSKKTLAKFASPNNESYVSGDVQSCARNSFRTHAPRDAT